MNKDYLISLVFIITTSIGIVWFSRFIIFEEFIPNETVQIVGQIFIEASATLIGFWGVVLVFVLKSTQSYKEQRNTEIYKILRKQTELTIKKEFEEKKQDYIEKQIKLNDNWLKHLENRVTWANELISAVCVMGMSVVALFILCIFSSLSMMSTSMTTSLEPPQEFVKNLPTASSELLFPLTFFALGIIFIFGLMIVLFVVHGKPKDSD
jgi:hypothetical protein